MENSNFFLTIIYQIIQKRMAACFFCCPWIVNSLTPHELNILVLVFQKVCRCVVTHLALKMFRNFIFLYIILTMLQMATAVSLLPAAVWGGAGTRNPGRLLFIAVARAPATAEGAAQGMAQKGVESLRAEREVVTFYDCGSSRRSESTR